MGCNSQLDGMLVNSVDPGWVASAIHILCMYDRGQKNYSFLIFI